MPFRRAFGKKEIKAIKELIRYYNKRSEDPPYYGHFQKTYEKEYVKKTSKTEGFARAVSTEQCLLLSCKTANFLLVAKLSCRLLLIVVLYSRL